MTEIKFTCTNCSVNLEADGSFAGSIAQCPNCNSTVMIPMPGISPRMKIGGYEIIRRLGAGGMGEVWLANQTSLGRKVALKILSPALTSRGELINRFLKEVKTTAKLDHTNIITAYDAGVDNGIYYLAMSYVDGIVLSDRLSIDKKIPEKEALTIIRSIAEALRYSWNKYQILHRDIKPANIMIDANGVPKLMDMGISKSLSEEEGLTITGMIVGTPHYMSPEQAHANSSIDCRADIYSLGATLYHIVTGEVPYDATTMMGILMKHVEDPFPPPREKNPELSVACSALLEIMMAKNPDERQKNWDIVIEDIDLVLEGNFPNTKRPVSGVTTVIMTTESQALNRRKTLRLPQKAKLTHTVNEAGDKTQIAESVKGQVKSNAMPIIIAFASVLIVAGIIVSAIMYNSNTVALAEKEKARMEQEARQKAEDEKIKAAEAAKTAELEKQKEAEKTAKIEKHRQELWDEAAKFAKQALSDNSNFEAAIAILEKIKENCKGTKFEIMADAEIAKIAKAGKEIEEEKFRKTEEEKRLASELAKNAEKPKSETVKEIKEIVPAPITPPENIRTGKFPVPTDSNVKSARGALRNTFKDEFSKKKDEEKLAFSKSLREMAATEKDAVQKYSLFAEAASLAIDAGNLDEALAAVTEMCDVFDAPSAKEKRLVLATFAKKASKPEDLKNLVDKYLSVITEAMAESDSATASELLNDCRPIASKMKDKAVINAVSDKAKDVSLLTAEIGKLKPSMDRLREYPDDPEANLVVGRHLCFVKGEWNKGMPMLAKGADAKSMEAAKADIGNPADPEKMAYIADLWYDIGNYEKIPTVKLGIHSRAKFWYEKSVSGLGGIPKARVEKRISEIGKIIQSDSDGSSKLATATPKPIQKIKLKKATDNTMNTLRSDLQKANGIKELSNFNYSLSPVIYLSAPGNKIKDISPLAGLNIESLDIFNNEIESIEALRGMPLSNLGCSNTKIRSIEPLAGMKISMLCCANTQIDSVEALRGMPLKSLDISNNLKLKDISPLADCKSLEKLSIPAGLTNVEFLKKLPKLKFLDTKWGEKMRTAEQFWKDQAN